jgi:DNA-binding NarL/FixJ family response regulator
MDEVLSGPTGSGGMGDVVRILVADDHPLTRDGIKAALALDADFEVVAEAGDGQEAVDLAEEVKPDVVLMDVRMPVLGGIRATQTISRTVPSARVVMLTVEETQARVGEAIQAGAAGYLLKDIDAHELARAVHLAAEGSAVIHPNLTRQFIEEIRQLTRGEQSVSTLSAREVEVLQMIAYGLTNREVAEALHISPQTVKTYLERIFTKLGVSDRTRAVAVALKHGIVE